MDNNIEVLKQIYDCFNARDIDGVLDKDMGNLYNQGQAHHHYSIVLPM